MVFNTNFNNISDISWWSVLLVEETGVFRENVAKFVNKIFMNFNKKSI
jgi:activator of HSP90 ATPase